LKEKGGENFYLVKRHEKDISHGILGLKEEILGEMKGRGILPALCLTFLITEKVIVKSAMQRVDSPTNEEQDFVIGTEKTSAHRGCRKPLQECG
jgi:hypothetical protein